MNTSQMEREILTLQQASEILGVTTRTLRNWRRDGKIRAFKLGGRWKIRHEEIDRVLNRPTGRLDASDE